ncbi:hypothetical protein T02_15633 [Trichinella nativa]|uniref:Uncharacterized protein n=1 Tax=Trichinella nativa TaxID=6335 RepID=A0A0V1KW29_9BILA|nr:hypothetical protein T06_15044 [Trichinella sp. T6]KRZ51302.1 hypothetical protein T02_15633 [Trichinella nativa]
MSHLITSSTNSTNLNEEKGVMWQESVFSIARRVEWKTVAKLFCCVENGSSIGRSVKLVDTGWTRKQNRPIVIDLFFRLRTSFAGSRVIGRSNDTTGSTKLAILDAFTVVWWWSVSV